MPELDDIELLAQYARDHSEAAFAALVTRHVNLVYSTALRNAGNPHAAEEITQAVFIILAGKARSLSPQTVLSGWLYQTARLTAANFLRTEIRRQNREQEAYMQSLLNEPEPNVWPQIAPLLDAAMAGLGEKDRNAVVLRFFENKSLGEVGRALGASEDAAKMRVNRALEKLRKFFYKRGVTLSGAIIAGAVSANSVQAAPVGLAITVTATAAKGSAAAASTLTLVKGALKLMAWTKMKTAAVTGAVVLLTAGTGVVAVKTVHAARSAGVPDIQGAWEGVLDTGGTGIQKGETTKTRVVARIFKKNGVYQSTADTIDEGRKDVPISKFVYNYPSVRVELSQLSSWYQATVNSDATEMSGTFKGGDRQTPLVLKRTTEPDAVPEPLADGDFAPRRDSDLQGYWKGTLKAGNFSLHLNVKIAEPAKGTFRAELDNFDQGQPGQPMSVSYNPPNVKLPVMTGSGMFEGTVNGNDTEMDGDWIEGGQHFPMNFKRADWQAEQARETQKDYSHAGQNDLPGHWKGTLNANRAKLQLALDVAKLPDGTYSCSMTSLDQGRGEIPASTTQYFPPNLRLEWNAIGVSFNGKLENGKLTGAWRQGGGAVPLVLERNGAN
jgi:RNA polymerase sigma factor (sigma-70 family)